MFDAGKMDLDDGAHRVGIRKADVMEKAAAQEGVRQFFLIVGGNDDNGTSTRMNRFASFVDEEFHAIELLQEIVGKLDVGLVDFIDQQNPMNASHSLPRLM